MSFAVSAAKKQILQKLTERDWTPTDLAEELGKSPETVYNHLHELEEQGVLSTRRVDAKTRPKTEYSIGDGLVQYVAVLPGRFQEGALELDPSKEATVRIWLVPQTAFHPHLERYWWTLRTHDDIALATDVAAVAVYGSVARGEADRDSDIDILAVANDEQAAAALTEHLGSRLVETPTGTRICMTEVYTLQDYRTSLAQGSDFLATVRDECHPIYDPDRILLRSAVTEAA